MRSLALTGSGAWRPVSVRCHWSPPVPGKLPFARRGAPVEGGGASLPFILLLPCVAMREQRGKDARVPTRVVFCDECVARSEEHTSELQSLMRNSYAVFCLKKKK